VREKTNDSLKKRSGSLDVDRESPRGGGKGEKEKREKLDCGGGGSEAVGERTGTLADDAASTKKSAEIERGRVSL